MYPNWSNFLSIPETLRVIAICWEAAEDLLRDEVRDNSPDIGEEPITQMFHGKLAQMLREASDYGYIEQAFLTDLRQGFPDLVNGPELSQIAQGLIADVTLHKRDTEQITGGDLGFMIIRPQVRRSFSQLNISGYRRGILCQAKLRRASGKWGSFSSNQKKILPERLGYLGLLLYSYQDKERRNLQRFQWQLCEGAKMEEVTSWLRKGQFPFLANSDAIIEALGNARIGTDDDRIIDEIVSPANNPCLTITISWPHGSGPSSTVYVYSSQQVRQKTEIRLLQ